MTQVLGLDNHDKPKRLGSKQVIIKMLRFIIFLFFIKKTFKVSLKYIKKNQSSEIIYKQ
jgi:hypothetical protein